MMACAVAFIERFGLLLNGLWMTVDVSLDIRQAIVYRQYAFDKNGTYHQWAINNTDPSTNYTETVSHWYFHTSCIIFFLPPLILTVCSMVNDISGGDAFLNNSPTKIVLEKYNIKMNTKDGGNCNVLICYPFLFLLQYVFICLQCYLLTPLTALVIGCKIALTGVINLEEEVVSFRHFNMSGKDLPFLLFYGYFFEALPQLTLSIVFLCNNYTFLLAFDTIQGIPLPVSLISCIFSGGSLMIGIFYTCWCCMAALSLCLCCCCCCRWLPCQRY